MLIVVKITPAAKAEACSGACELVSIVVTVAVVVVVVVFLVVVGPLTVVVVGAGVVTTRLMGDD